MHGHDPDRVGRRRGVALHLDLALTEPGKEAVERGYFLLLEGQGAGDQLFDWVAGRFAETTEELAPAVERAGQDDLEEACRGDIVRHG